MEKGLYLSWMGSPAMRGTLADAFRQATRSSLLSKPSRRTGSSVSSELATTCYPHTYSCSNMIGWHQYTAFHDQDWSENPSKHSRSIMQEEPILQATMLSAPKPETALHCTG